MDFVNASHRPPYIYRQEKIKPLMDARCNPLGHDLNIQVEPATVALEPGDVILWYTDGVLECTNPEGKTISRNSLVKMVKSLHERHASNAPAICEDFMADTMAFFGPNAANLADDVTIVFGAVPPNVQFQKKSFAA
ncbi:MAG TPA: PP2C family protein-serine/threonine phosphatase, partial [Oligoflexia bacterium]|nr:PP2C family protein-serine/threonine phosphatase [Oligoflexia bacterium]